MTTIFIAKGKEEFEKYRRGNRQIAIEGTAYYDQTKIENNRYVVKRTTLGEYLLIRELECLVFSFEDNEMKNVLRDCIGTTDIYRHSMTFFETVSKCLLSIEENKGIVLGKNIRFFIHWGDGAPYTYENTFRDFYTTGDGEALVKKFFKEIRAYAISTRRPENFDVRGEIISIPKRVEYLDILESRFRLDSVKDVLYEYVIAFQHHNSEQPLMYPLKTDYVKTTLCQCLKDKMDEWQHMYSKEKFNWRRTATEGVLEHLSKGDALPISENYAALFSKVLEEDDND